MYVKISKGTSLIDMVEELADILLKKYPEQSVIEKEIEFEMSLKGENGVFHDDEEEIIITGVFHDDN